MREMTPEWFLQILWFMAGIAGTGAIWYFLSQQQYHAALWSGFLTAVIILLTVALYLRNDLIRRTAGRDALEMTAFFYEEPHANESDVCGIRWQHEFVDVRVLIENKAKKNCSDIQLSLHPETQIHAIRQVTKIPHVVLSPYSGADVHILAGKIVVADSSGTQTSIPLSFSGPRVSAPMYRLNCPQLMSGDRIELILACVALNPMEKDGSFPQSLYSNRRLPKWLRIQGSYQVLDGINTIGYDIKRDFSF